MSQIRLQNVSFGYTSPLFEDVNITIDQKDRIGIVGNNGEGKSTLLQCIAGIITDYDGQIIRPKNFKFGFIEQGLPDDVKDLSIYDVIAAKIPEEERDFNLWKVDVALDTFKAPNSIRTRSIKELSGGWQRLALIARVAMTEPDMLLLDEPTNHLDVAKIMALEEWLNDQVYDTPIVAVSHDRGFLEACTNRTIFLRGAQTMDYKYSYEQARKLLAEDDKAAKAQREAELAELERLEKSAHDQRQVGKDNFSDAALQKAKQIQRRADQLRASLTAVYNEARRDIKLRPSDIHAKQLINIQNVDIKAPDGAQLFHIDSLSIKQGERIVILGVNGAGKSQFIQHLNRAFADKEAARTQGITITPTARLGYVDQHLTNLPKNSTLREYVQNVSPIAIDNQRTTSTLVAIGFPYETQQTKIKDLSYGQRSRLNLLGLRLIEPNFYVMDEPTNHLDIAGQEALEAEIIEHGAASILVSHDRAFVKNIGTSYYQIDKGKLKKISAPDAFYKALETSSALDDSSPTPGQG